MTSQQASPPLRPAAVDVAVLFRARYLEMVRLAGLLGADDPEDIAQEAFARLMRKGGLDADPASYLRAIVCNLTRNRHRHLRVVRAKTLRAVSEPSSEQAAILREDHAEVIAAAAAATVAAVALSATALAHGFSGTTGPGAAVQSAAAKAASGSTLVPCAGQCGPPYELMVLFQPGTTHAAAQQLLTSCTDQSPVVIRVGPLGVDPSGLSRAFIYTQVFGPSNPSRTAGLLTCPRHSSLTYEVGWPD